MKHQINDEKRAKVDAALAPLFLSDEKVEKIRKAFWEQIQLANSEDENVRKTSSHLMLNSFIREILDGTEQGDYLGLDLGGTNFRIVLVHFKDGVAETETAYYHMAENLVVGPVAGIFDFIADSIKDFFERKGFTNASAPLPLGFTFSHPVKQLELNKSILIKWTKTFNCPDGIGDDPVQLLQQAIDRRAKGLPVNIVVLTNDTVGTMLAGNYLDKKCRIGLIVGTGCNASFVQKIDDIPKWTGDKKDPKHVIMNIEMGATGDNGCLDFARSSIDKEMDRISNNPGHQTFEKSLSGMYLGELARMVLVALIKDGVLFSGNAPQLVNAQWDFMASDVAAIESDEGDDSTNTKKVLERFGIASPSDEDLCIVKEICECLSLRGARFVGAAMSSVVSNLNMPEITIGIDGSLYEKHPKWHRNMQAVFDKFNPNTEVKMILAKDGSGQGGAFAAVSALKQAAKGLKSL